MENPKEEKILLKEITRIHEELMHPRLLNVKVSESLHDYNTGKPSKPVENALDVTLNCPLSQTHFGVLKKNRQRKNKSRED